MKNAALSLCIGVACFAPAALAETTPSPVIEIVDTGPDVIIVARHIKLADEAAIVRSNRIEVALDGTPAALTNSSDDSTVSGIGIRVRSGGERRLTIDLRAGRDAARQSARTARIRQVGDTIQVIIARAAGEEPAATFIEDGVTKALAAQAAAGDDEKQAAAAPVAGATNATPATPSAPDPAPLPPAAAQRAGATSVIGLVFLFIAAVAIGFGAREWQKRRAAPPTANGIEVLSVKNVGPKLRLMLVAVGDREMLLTVGPQGSNVVGRWRRNGATAPHDFDDQAYPPQPANLYPEAANPYPRAVNPHPQPVNPQPQAASPYAQAASAYSYPPPASPASPIAEPPQTRTSNFVAAALARRSSEPAPAARRGLARGSTNPAEAVAEWNRRPTSPSIRGILELRDQTLALEDVLGQTDEEIDVEWEQALAGGTRSGRLR